MKIKLKLSSKESLTKFRNLFIAGLFIILPTIVTIWAITLIVNLFGSPFAKIINAFIASSSPGGILEIITGFIISIFFIALIGFVGKMAFAKSFTKKYEDSLGNIPFISSIYSTIKNVIEAINSDKRSFKKVVLVEFPNKGFYSIGFVSRDDVPNLKFKDGKEHTLNHSCVFVPTSPNPTTGFFLMINKNDIQETNLSVEEGIKLILSFGLVTHPIKDINFPNS